MRGMAGTSPQPRHQCIVEFTRIGLPQFRPYMIDRIADRRRRNLDGQVARHFKSGAMDPLPQFSDKGLISPDYQVEQGTVDVEAVQFLLTAQLCHLSKEHVV